MSVVDKDGYEWVWAITTPYRSTKSWKMQLEPPPKRYAWLPLKVVAASVAVTPLVADADYGVTRILVSKGWLDLAKIPSRFRFRHEPTSLATSWLTDSAVTEALGVLRGEHVNESKTIDEDQLGLLVGPKGGGEW